MENVKIIAGSSSLSLSHKICKHLDTELVDVTINKFANGEIRVLLNEQVRNSNIFIVQTGTANNSGSSINDILIETLFLIDCCKKSDARTVNLICPNYFYARMDKKTDGRCCISASLIASMLENAGLNRIVCVDLHNPSIQGFFQKIPADNLFCLNLMHKYLQDNYFKNDYKEKFVLISPDVGAAPLIKKASSRMGLPFLLCNKTRDYSKNNVIEEVQVIGNQEKYLEGRTALILDDMADTCGTIKAVIDALKDKGAREVIVIISHGIFSGPAIERINSNNNLSKIICSNSIEQTYNLEKCHKLEVFDISKLLFSVIDSLINGKSISRLFD